MKYSIVTAISPKRFIKRLHQFKMPVRPVGAVCALLQIGLQRGGKAQHGPETPQLRDTHVHQVWQAHFPREELTVF